MKPRPIACGNSLVISSIGEVYEAMDTPWDKLVGQIAQTYRK